MPELDKNENYVRGLTVFYKANGARHMLLYFWNQVKFGPELLYLRERVVNSVWVLTRTPSLFGSVVQGQKLWPCVLSRDLGFILVTPEKTMLF